MQVCSNNASQQLSETTLAFTTPLGFVQPNDSRACKTPWSVFQDGSDGRLTNLLLTLSTQDRLALPVTREQAWLPNLQQSNSPGRSGSHEGQSGRSCQSQSYLRRRLKHSARVKCIWQNCVQHQPRAVKIPKDDSRARFDKPTLQIHPLTSERFHKLLNSLLNVLFNFPSRYLSRYWTHASI